MASYLQVVMILTTLTAAIQFGSTVALDPVTKLIYDCDSNGNMTIKIPTGYSLQNIDSSACKNSTEKNKVVLINCKNKNQTIALMHKSLLGGKMPIFSLKCVDSKYTIQLNATALPIDTNPTPTPMPTHTISHNEIITMMIKNDHGIASKAVIGDKLSLVISAPHNFKIDPLKCSAVSGDDDYPIWNASSAPKCNVEESVMESNWNVTNQTDKVEYSIVMYAFRLVSSESVKISCTVEVCPSGVSGCTQVCVNSQASTQNRKRRNAVPLNSEKVNRRLETNLRVYDSVEDKIQASGASVITNSYVTLLCALVSALYHK